MRLGKGRERKGREGRKEVGRFGKVDGRLRPKPDGTSKMVLCSLASLCRVK